MGGINERKEVLRSKFVINEAMGRARVNESREWNGVVRNVRRG